MERMLAPSTATTQRAATLIIPILLILILIRILIIHTHTHYQTHTHTYTLTMLILALTRHSHNSHITRRAPRELGIPPSTPEPNSRPPPPPSTLHVVASVQRMRAPSTITTQRVHFSLFPSTP